MPFISLHTILVESPNNFAKHTTILLLYIFIISLSIFWKYIYPAAHISKHLFLHFSYTISYTLTISLHITHHNSFKLHSHTLSLWNSTILLPINTSLYSSLTKIFLLESYLYNFSSNYNLIFLPFLISISLILPYIIHITNITSHKTSIPFTISTLLKRYQTFILKALLMEGMNFYY